MDGFSSSCFQKAGVCLSFYVIFDFQKYCEVSYTQNRLFFVISYLVSYHFCFILRRKYGKIPYDRNYSKLLNSKWWKQVLHFDRIGYISYSISYFRKFYIICKFSVANLCKYFILVGQNVPSAIYKTIFTFISKKLKLRNTSTLPCSIKILKFLI